MGIVKWIFALPFIVGAVLFALAHPTPVVLTYSPFAEPIELPLYFVALLFLGIGFLLGAFMAWLGMGDTRKQKRAYKKEVKLLNKDTEKLKENIEQLEEKLEKHELEKALRVIDHEQ